MQVEINEVVSTVRVVDNRAPAMSAHQMQSLIEAVMRGMETRVERERQRAGATEIPDDGRGGVSRQGWGVSP